MKSFRTRMKKSRIACGSWIADRAKNARKVMHEERRQEEGKPGNHIPSAVAGLLHSLVENEVGQIENGVDITLSDAGQGMVHIVTKVKDTDPTNPLYVSACNMASQIRKLVTMDQEVLKTPQKPPYWKRCPDGSIELFTEEQPDNMRKLCPISDALFDAISKSDYTQDSFLIDESIPKDDKVFVFDIGNRTIIAKWVVEGNNYAGFTGYRCTSVNIGEAYA